MSKAVNTCGSLGSRRQITDDSKVRCGNIRL